MKTDDFESQLKRQPLKSTPEAWRADILSTARDAAARMKSADGPAAPSWWRELLWPCPQAWAGLAAAWAVILYLNIAGSAAGAVKPLEFARPASLEETLAERRAIMVELAEWKPLPAEVPKRKPLRPHGCRREDFAMA